MKYINEFIKYKEYKGEKAIYRVNDNCGNTYYSDEYVNWLEEQLRIHDVGRRSEQLVCTFCGINPMTEICKHPKVCSTKEKLKQTLN